MNPLHGRTALITGSSRGIGRAIAIALAEAGADVAVNYLHREAEAQAVEAEIRQLGRRSTTVQADVSSATGVARPRSSRVRAIVSARFALANKP